MKASTEFVVLLCPLLGGCPGGLLELPGPDGGEPRDAQIAPPEPDSGTVSPLDASPIDAAPPDLSIDAGPDAALDVGFDSGTEVRPDLGTPPPQPGVHARWLVDNGASEVIVDTSDGPGGANEVLAFQIRLPENYDPSQTYPLIVYLHGGDPSFLGVDNHLGSATNPPFETLFFKGTYGLDTFGTEAVVLVPQLPEVTTFDTAFGTGAGLEAWGRYDYWDPGNRYKVTLSTTPSAAGSRVLRLVRDLAAGRLSLGGPSLRIDARRVYLTGFGLGSLGTWDLLARDPNLWAAALTLAGGAPHDAAGDVLALPIWAFHSDADDIDPYRSTKNMQEEVRARGGTLMRMSDWGERNDRSPDALDIRNDDTEGVVWGEASHESFNPDVSSRNPPERPLDWLFSQQRP